MRKSQHGGSYSLLGWVGVTIRYLFCAGLFIVPIFYLLLSLGIQVAVGRTSYESILGWYSARRPNSFDIREMATRCFTPRWYEGLRVYRLPVMAGIIVLLILYLLCSRRVWRCLQELSEEIGKIGRFMVRTFGELNGRERGWLLLLFAGVFLYRLYFFFAYPLHPDEVFSYLYFARQGFLVTATSYPLPNNHVLFNIICSCLSKLPWMSPKAVMRLPNMAGDLILLYGIFCLFRRWGGFQRAILTVAGVSFCHLLSFYAVQGRGYELQLLCAMVTGLAGWECFCGERRHLRRGYGLFIIASVAGVYINPTFLYHFTALMLMFVYFSLRRREYRGFLLSIRAALLTGVLVFILYLPLVLASSWRALSDSTPDKKWTDYGGLLYSLADFAYDFKTIAYYGRPGFWLLCGLSVLLLYLYKKKKLAGNFYDHSIVYFICVGVSLLLWSVYTMQYPMDRTLCSLALAMYLFFVTACYDLSRAWLGRAAPWIFGCFLLVRAAGSMRGLYWEPDSVDVRPESAIRRHVEADMEKLDRLHPASWQITRSDDYYSMYLQLHLIEKGDTGRVVLRRDAAVGDVIFLPESYLPFFHLEGYRLWADKRWTVEAKSLEIYVARAIGGVGAGDAAK